MSDLIRRNDVVEAIEFEKVYMTAYKGSSSGYVSEGNPFKQYNKGLDDAIKAVNSLAPAEPKWIPVTEALPEEEKEVLVSMHFDGYKDEYINYPPSDYVEIASHIDGVWSSICDDFRTMRRLHHVIAWMPLPEPWRGEL